MRAPPALPAALLEGAAEALLANIPTLTEILTFHVVPGAVHAADVTDGLAPATVNGAELHFSTTDGVTVNVATVVTADVVCDNGVIHVIDAVLLP